ncbi:hypothetical protein BN1007_120320 [Klebsiella variicola]|nr:hypothetical protein BN1007_120320 [Klebsiella variicola]
MSYSALKKAHRSKPFAKHDNSLLDIGYASPRLSTLHNLTHSGIRRLSELDQWVIVRPLFSPRLHYASGRALLMRHFG